MVIEGTARPHKKKNNPDWGDGQKTSFEIISGTGFFKNLLPESPMGFRRSEPK